MSGSLLDMESPVEDEEGRVLKHADSDSVNSIPPPPPPLGMSAVPVASEESCDITEAERLRQAEEDEEEARRRHEAERMEAERQHHALEAQQQQLQQQHLYAEPQQLQHQHHHQQQQHQQDFQEHHTLPEEQQHQEDEPLHPQHQHQQQQQQQHNYEEDGAENDTQEHQSQQQMLVSVEPSTSTKEKQKETAEGHGDSCCDKFLKCLGLVPCPTLLSWILLLLGVGCLTGGLLIGTRDTRTLLEDQRLLWFMEYTVIGVSSGMFLVGCLILLASHLSSEPTSRRVFNSFKKNKCAQGMNIFALVVCYILTVSWVLATAIFAVPVVAIITLLIVDPDSVDLGDFGFKGGIKKGEYLETFKEESKDLLICWGIVFCSSVVIVNSLICFIICVTANITHLRDNRFSTLNAYGSAEVRNSKHSVIDTNM